MGGEINILKENSFLPSKNFKLLSQTKGNLISDCFEFIISVRE
jgi:hypothetical protein